MQHGGVRPAGHALFREHGGDRLPFALQGVGLIRPGAGGHHAFVFKVAHLHRGVVPVAVDQRVLAAQQLQRRLILFFVELIRIADAELRLGGLQEQRRVGDVDRAVVSLHPAWLLLPSGRFCCWKITAQLSGGVGKVLVLYISRFGPHWYGVP